MKEERINLNGKYYDRQRYLYALFSALSVALLLVLVSVTTAFAGNGITADVDTLFDAVDGAGGDFVIACPKVLDGTPDPGGTLDGKCGADGDEPLFAAFGNAEDRRIRRGAGELESNKTVSGHAFGALIGTFSDGTSSGDVVCWTFERSRAKRFESSDMKVCAKVLPGPGSSPSFCGIGRRPAELRIRQDLGVCNEAATRLGLPQDSLAYLFAADTSRLAQAGSATITTCSTSSTSFVVQCLDPASLALNDVDVMSTRPIDAYDGTYVSRRLW